MERFQSLFYDAEGRLRSGWRAILFLVWITFATLIWSFLLLLALEAL